MIAQTHALWITQASSTTIQALLSLRECSINILSKFPPKQTPPPIWSTGVITTWLHIFLTKSFSDTLPSPPLKKGYATSASRNKHQQRNSKGPLCKILRITQTRQFTLIELFQPKTSEDVSPMCPITLVMNITTMLKAVNYIRKMFHYKCLTRS